MKPAAILALALTAAAICTPTLAEEQKALSASQRFTLVCRAQMVRKIIAVDIARRTIDGRPANFSEAAITWKTGGDEALKKKGEKKAAAKAGVMHELDRLEGTYRSWNEDEPAEKALTYGCEKAPPQKF